MGYNAGVVNNVGGGWDAGSELGNVGGATDVVELAGLAEFVG